MNSPFSRQTNGFSRVGGETGDDTRAVFGWRLRRFVDLESKAMRLVDPVRLQGLAPFAVGLISDGNDLMTATNHFRHQVQPSFPAEQGFALVFVYIIVL